MTSKLLVLALLALITTASIPSTAAWSDERSVEDPNDSDGALDISSVTQSHGSWKGLVRHTLTTYEEWDSSLLAGDSNEEGTTWGHIFFTLNSGRFCCGSGTIRVKVNTDGSLYAEFHREGFHGYGRAWRPDERSVTVEFQKKVFARKLEQYSWQGGTSYADPDNEDCPGWTSVGDHRTLEACFDYTDSRRHRVVVEPDVRIEQIFIDPKGRDSGSNAHVNKEYILIRNHSNRRIDLEGWSLHDHMKRNRYRFDVSLGPTEELYLYSGKGPDGGVTGCNGACHNTFYLYWDRAHYVWNNTGDTAVLRDPRGDVIDRCRYRTPSKRSVNC